MRRITQEVRPVYRGARIVAAMVGVCLAAFTLSGCSTNLTGFDFPSFGLTKKSDDTATGSLGQGGMPPPERKLSVQ